MVTIDLLKAEHGLRANFQRTIDRNNRWKLIASRLVPAAVLLLILFFGLYFIGSKVLSFLNEVDEHYEELADVPFLPVPDTGMRNVNIQPGELVDDLTHKGVVIAVEGADNDEKREPEPLLTFLPEVKRDIDGNEKQEPEIRVDLNKIRVATTILRANAVLIKNRLKEAGFASLVEAGDADMPFRQLKYSGLSGKELKKVLDVFKRYSIDYTLKKKGDGHAVVSRKIFVPTTRRAVTSELKSFGISGSNKKGRSSAEVFRVFLNGFFGPGEVEKKMGNLASHGFSPVAVAFK